jgi:hypothetical protein
MKNFTPGQIVHYSARDEIRSDIFVRMGRPDGSVGPNDPMNGVVEMRNHFRYLIHSDFVHDNEAAAQADANEYIATVAAAKTPLELEVVEKTENSKFRGFSRKDRHSVKAGIYGRLEQFKNEGIKRIRQQNPEIASDVEALMALRTSLRYHQVARSLFSWNEADTFAAAI